MDNRRLVADKNGHIQWCDQPAVNAGRPMFGKWVAIIMALAAGYWLFFAEPMPELVALVCNKAEHHQCSSGEVMGYYFAARLAGVSNFTVLTHL
jgi:hypothetical protein